MQHTSETYRPPPVPACQGRQSVGGAGAHMYRSRRLFGVKGLLVSRGWVATSNLAGGCRETLVPSEGFGVLSRGHAPTWCELDHLRQAPVCGRRGVGTSWWLLGVGCPGWRVPAGVSWFVEVGISSVSGGACWCASVSSLSGWAVVIVLVLAGGVRVGVSSCECAVGYWLLVIGCWSLAVGCWLLAVGYWLVLGWCWVLGVIAD